MLQTSIGYFTLFFQQLKCLKQDEAELQLTFFLACPKLFASVVTVKGAID